LTRRIFSLRYKKCQQRGNREAYLKSRIVFGMVVYPMCIQGFMFIFVNFLHGVYMPSNGGHIIREENKIMKKVKCNELCNNKLIGERFG